MSEGVLLLRYDLDEDLRVIRLAQLLDKEVDAIIGKLWRFWRHVEIHAKDGVLADYNADTIDGVAQMVGFGNALLRVGWLRLEIGGAIVPNPDEWLGPDAASRLLKRVEKARGPAPGFQQFWDAYPRKTNRKRAEDAWNRLAARGDLLRLVMDGLARAKESRQWRLGVIPHPSTWLRNWRWEDEHDDPSVEGATRVVAEAGKYDSLSEGRPVVPARPEP